MEYKEPDAAPDIGPDNTKTGGSAGTKATTCLYREEPDV